MNPATAALADQAKAASREAVNALHTLARRGGTTIHTAPIGPITATILGRLAARALTRQLALCDHLSLTAPRPAFWAAWAPHQIRCAHCCETAAAHIHGTTEDHTCDHCGRVSDVIHAVAAQLPAVVLGARAGRQPFAVPPVQVQFGLCPGCRAADQLPAAHHTPIPTSRRFS